jgi:hypothetical protein
MKNLTGPAGLAAWLNRLEATNRLRRAKATSEVTHYYADGTNGDDANDGEKAGQAVKTLDRLFELIPEFVRHRVVCHLVGTFTPTQDLNLQKTLFAPLVIDGGAGVTVLDDNTGSNYAIDGATTASSLVATGSPGWTTDEHFGYWIEILDSGGNPTGQVRTVESNAAGSLVPTVDFDPVPTDGSDVFRIVEPATVIDGNWAFIIGCSCVAAGDAGFNFQTLFVQRLKLNIQSFVATAGESVISGAIMTRANSFVQPRHGAPSFLMGLYHHDISTGTTLYGSGANKPHLALSVIPTSAEVSSNVGLGSLAGVVCRKLNLYGEARISVINCRVKGPVTLANATMNILGFDKGLMIDNAAAVGLTAKSSYIAGAKLSINNCGSHAIELQDSFLDLAGIAAGSAISGSSNTGAALYAHLGSKAVFPSGKAPTLEGTVGDISLDGTTEESTWAAIDADTPINGATVGNDEFVIVKEV